MILTVLKLCLQLKSNLQLLLFSKAKKPGETSKPAKVNLLVAPISIKSGEQILLIAVLLNITLEDSILRVIRMRYTHR